jgi:hypothetical protein
MLRLIKLFRIMRMFKSHNMNMMDRLLSRTVGTRRIVATAVLRCYGEPLLLLLLPLMLPLLLLLWLLLLLRRLLLLLLLPSPAGLTWLVICHPRQGLPPALLRALRLMALTVMLSHVLARCGHRNRHS